MLSLIPRNILVAGVTDTKEHFVAGVADTKEHFVTVADTKEHFVAGVADTKEHFVAGVADAPRKIQRQRQKSQQVLPTRKIPKGI